MRRFVLLCAVAASVGLLAAGAGVLAPQSGAAATAITPSPAYTAAQLDAPAGDNWLTHMGNLSGWRYSSLTQITKSNVATLK
jgi:glucose dehydrogenase